MAILFFAGLEICQENM